jgi:hypothetical protein
MSRTFDLSRMNSGMGEAWMNRWCRNCYRGENKCGILDRALGLGVQLELIYDEQTQEPICTKYKHKNDHVVQHRPNPDQTEIEL